MQVFFERKIIGHVFGTRAEQFHAVRGLDALRATVAGFGADHPYTCLVPSLDGVDPDDSFSRIPYEKGFYFLYYLQDLVGVEEFAAFTAVYLSTFGKRTATTGAFKALLLQHFEGHAAIQDVDWHKWLHEPGTAAPPLDLCPRGNVCFDLRGFGVMRGRTSRACRADADAPVVQGCRQM